MVCSFSLLCMLYEERIRLDMMFFLGQEDHHLYFIFYDACYVFIIRLARTLIKSV